MTKIFLSFDIKQKVFIRVLIYLLQIKETAIHQ